MTVSVPQLDDPELIKLIKLIDPLLKPILVYVKPEKYAQENECIQAVQEKISIDGGSQVFGWQVWKSDFWIEAEFHSLWKSPEGSFLDITPKNIPISPDASVSVSSIIFLLDPKIEYTGAQIDNIRLNITNNEIIDDIIKMFEIEFQLLNTGARALEYEVRLSDEEFNLFKKIKQNRLYLYLMAKNNMNIESDCFCGSNKKYKDCCRERIMEISKS